MRGLTQALRHLGNDRGQTLPRFIMIIFEKFVQASFDIRYFSVHFAL